MDSQNLNNYHWTEGDITEFTLNYLKDSFINLSFTVEDITGESFIVQRMGSVHLIYFLNLKLKKEDRQIILEDFDQFSDFTEVNMTDRQMFKQVFTEFKDYAIKKYSSIVLNNDKKENKKKNVKKHKNMDIISTPSIEQINRKVCENRGDIQFHFYFNCGNDDLHKFLLDHKFINIWTGGRMEKYEKNGIMIKGEVVLNNVKSIKNKVLLDFMICKQNKDYKATILEFSGNDKKSKIDVTIKCENRDLKGMYVNIWKSLIIDPMCLVLGFKNFENDDFE